MRKFIFKLKFCFLSIFLAAGLLTTTANITMAQDPLEVGEDIYKLKFENDRVRILEVAFVPNATIAMHSHPDHFVYVLSKGKLNISYPDGSTKEVDVKVGDVMWMDAQTHSANNSGEDEIRLLVVELKEKKPLGTQENRADEKGTGVKRVY